MGSSEGLRRGLEATNTGGPIAVPVGDKLLHDRFIERVQMVCHFSANRAGIGEGFSGGDVDVARAGRCVACR